MKSSSVSEHVKTASTSGEYVSPKDIKEWDNELCKIGKVAKCRYTKCLPNKRKRNEKRTK